MNRLSTRLSRLEVGSRPPVPCTVLSYPRGEQAADVARFQEQLDEAIRGGGRVIVAVAYSAPYPALPPGDELRTSDDYLLAASAGADLYEVSYTGKKPWLARLLAHAGEALGQFRGI